LDIFDSPWVDCLGGAERKHLMHVRQYIFCTCIKLIMHAHQNQRVGLENGVGYFRRVGQLRISVHPASDDDFAGAEELLERLDLPDEALENLCRLARLDEEPFLDGGGWSARVELDSTKLLVRARVGRWTIYAAPDTDDAMHAARRLHGLIGATADGWDLDR
jgi:hypothetical protein